PEEAAADTEDRRDRSQETRRQRQGKFHQRRGDRDRPAEDVADADTEDPRDQSQETERQRQSGGRRSRRGGKAGPATRPTIRSLSPAIGWKTTNLIMPAETATIIARPSPAGPCCWPPSAGKPVMQAAPR